MKKTVILIVSVVFLALLSMGINFHLQLTDINRVPKGEFIRSEESPNGDYRLNLYLSNGGATVDYAIRGEAEIIKTGKKRNIYWEYPCKEAEVEWEDNETVVINGKRLNILTDKYDWRDYE